MTTNGPDAVNRLTAIVASADDSIISTDLDGTITSWNPAAERMFGYSAEEAIGSPIFLIIPDDRRLEERDVLARAREGSGINYYETVRRRKDGTLLEISLTVSPIRGPSGDTVVGVSKIARDVTVRRRLERDVLWLAAIVRSSDDAIISKDLNGIIQTWNRGAEAIFGYSAAEVIGHPITIIVPEDRLHEEVEVLSRIRAGDSVDHFETIRRRKDGRLVDISLTVSPVRNADGKVLGASKIARDITEQKRLRGIVEDASRMKDEFLAVLSHELRTPLSTVLGYARMLRQQDMPLDAERRAKALEVLERNAQLLASLVDDVLDTSRMVTGKLRLTMESMALDPVLGEALETIEPAAVAKTVRLSAMIAPGLEIIGDRDRLRQVAWNLLSNAVKFTPSGGEVAIRAVREGPQVIVEVRDTGAGILPEHLPLIFQRFWQADPGASRELGGLGIGLALVRHVVELHGGQISAMSDGPGCGATFTVSLPDASTSAMRPRLSLVRHADN